MKVLLLHYSNNEINTDKFIIERSNDSKDFTVAGILSATPNNPGQNNYSFIDDISNVNASNPIIYYRLKMTDKDGKFTYSKIVSINIDNLAASVKLFPNPASSVLNVQLLSNTSSNENIKIVDAFGKTVLQKTLIGNVATTSFNIENLSAGIYFVSLIRTGKLKKYHL